MSLPGGSLRSSIGNLFLWSPGRGWHKEVVPQAVHTLSMPLDPSYLKKAASCFFFFSAYTLEITWILVENITRQLILPRCSEQQVYSGRLAQYSGLIVQVNNTFLDLLFHWSMLNPFSFLMQVLDRCIRIKFSRVISRQFTTSKQNFCKHAKYNFHIDGITGLMLLLDFDVITGCFHNYWYPFQILIIFFHKISDNLNRANVS